MANTKSAIKRIQIAERNRLRNKSYKSVVKTKMKKSFQAITDYGKQPAPEKMELAEKLISETYSKIDKAVKHKVLHRNNGARKKARLAKALNKVTAAS